MNITLAFEPTRIGSPASAEINIVLINDSGYEIAFWLGATPAGRNSLCRLIGSDRIAAGEMLYVGRIHPGEADSIKSLTLQIIAWQKSEPFENLPPMSISRIIKNLTLERASSYRSGRYFDSPVIEVPIIKSGKIVEEIKADPTEILDSITDASYKALASKYSNRVPSKKKINISDADNPNKVIPLIEVDLHIHELIDTTAGMTAADILSLQLEEVSKTMKAHRRRIGQKIVFIHGKGDGVLRRELRNLLRRSFPTAEIQDASYQLYGGGATLVIIHQ